MTEWLKRKHSGTVKLYDNCLSEVIYHTENHEYEVSLNFAYNNVTIKIKINPMTPISHNEFMLTLKTNIPFLTWSHYNLWLSPTCTVQNEFYATLPINTPIQVVTAIEKISSILALPKNVVNNMTQEVNATVLNQYNYMDKLTKTLFFSDDETAKKTMAELLADGNSNVNELVYEWIKRLANMNRIYDAFLLCKHYPKNNQYYPKIQQLAMQLSTDLLNNEEISKDPEQLLRNQQTALTHTWLYAMTLQPGDVKKSLIQNALGVLETMTKPSRFTPPNPGSSNDDIAIHLIVQQALALKAKNDQIQQLEAQIAELKSAQSLPSKAGMFRFDANSATASELTNSPAVAG